MTEHYSPALLYRKEVILIAINAGKQFETDWKNSVNKLPDVWYYRLKDNAASFASGENTRFTSHNMCDCLVLDDKSKTLYCLEQKSTKGTSIPLSMIRKNQIDELKDASEHNLIAGFLFNFRTENNDTYFMSIQEFNKMISEIGKKSFNQKDLAKYDTVRVQSHIKKVNYSYDVKQFIKDTCEVNNVLQ